MSKQSTQQIDCPNCKHVQNFTVLDSLNGDLDPNAKQKLLNGTLFKYKCEKCGYEADIVYNMLYHDMGHNTMVYFVQPEMVEETKFQMEYVQQMMGKFGNKAAALTPLMKKPRNRIVTDQNRLREKAIIFDAGLDDRVVEVVKLFCWFEITKQRKDIRDDSLYFYIDNKGNYKVETLGGAISCDVSKNMYNDIAVQFKTFIDIAGEDYIVDNNFAGNIFLAINKALKD